MTDRELLELAAKAAGIVLGGETDTGFAIQTPTKPYVATWNPLTDDGDALRLAVALRFWIKDFAPHDNDSLDGELPAFGMVEIWRQFDDDPIYVEWYKPTFDRHAATRRAIVRAAAEIGKTC